MDAEFDEDAKDERHEKQVEQALLRMQLQQQESLEKALRRFDELETRLIAMEAEQRKRR